MALRRDLTAAEIALSVTGGDAGLPAALAEPPLVALLLVPLLLVPLLLVPLLLVPLLLVPLLLVPLLRVPVLLVPVLRVPLPFAPLLAGAEAPGEPPDRAAPPSIATAQPDTSKAAAIIAVTRATAQPGARTCPLLAAPVACGPVACGPAVDDAAVHGPTADAPLS